MNVKKVELSEETAQVIEFMQQLKVIQFQGTKIVAKITCDEDAEELNSHISETRQLLEKVLLDNICNNLSETECENILV